MSLGVGGRGGGVGIGRARGIIVVGVKISEYSHVLTRWGKLLYY